MATISTDHVTVGVLGQPSSPIETVPLSRLSDWHLPADDLPHAYIDAPDGWHARTPDGRVLVEVRPEANAHLDVLAVIRERSPDRTSRARAAELIELRRWR